MKQHKAFGYDQKPWKKFQKLTEELRGLMIDVSSAETQGKQVTQDQRKQIGDLLRDTLLTEKAVIGDLQQPKRAVGHRPPKRIAEARRKGGPPRAGRGLAASLPGGRCPGAVPGATLRQSDPDPTILAALIRECPHLTGGSGGHD